MKVTYKADTRTFQVIWKDYLKEARGEKSTAGRKSEKWKNDKKPTKKEIEEKIKELSIFATAEENKSKILADEYKKEMAEKYGQGFLEDEKNINAPKNAIRYLLQTPISKLTKSKKESTVKAAKRALNTMIIFLKDKYPTLALHEIKRPIIEEYLTYFSKYASQTLRLNYTYLGVLFKQIIDEFEDSSIKYFNHFKRYKIEELTKLNPENEKEDFSPLQLKKLLEYAVSDKKTSKDLKFQRFFILYFLIVTGWRKNEVFSLKWEQINFENRSISVIHKKTEDSSKFESVIFITPLMEKILKYQKKSTANWPWNKEFVFCFSKEAGEQSHHIKSKSNRLTNFIHEFAKKEKILKVTPAPSGKNFYNYSIHSLRHTAVTQLTLGKFSDERRRYLVGHAQKTIEGTNYTHLKKYPEQSTRDLIEFMEDLVNMNFFFHCLLKGSDSAAKIDYIKNSWLNETEIKQLKFNFWTDEAILILEKEWEKGKNRLLIDSIIFIADSTRLESGDLKVREENIKDILRMIEWFGVEETLKKQMEKISL